MISRLSRLSTRGSPLPDVSSRPLLKIIAVIAGVETAVMVLGGWARPDLFPVKEATLQASLVTLSSTVLLYFWLLRPLQARALASEMELEAARDRAEQLLQIDPLTGAANRRTFFEHFEREWDRTSRYSAPLTCIMMDLDQFRELNDRHGHLAGDAALRKIGQLLRSMCRSSDCICRYGGEEFCILLPETAEKEAADFAERIREAISEQPMEYGCGCAHVTGSFGVAQRHPQMTVLDNLIEAADRALVHSKQQGRNRVTRATSLLPGPMFGPANQIGNESSAAMM
jgi:diguanylate cyclase (GGDEF)-like protein